MINSPKYIKRLLLGGEKRRREFCSRNPNMCFLFKKFFAEKLELINKFICPYCNRRFKALRTFSKHVFSRHYEELMFDIYEFLEVWKKLRRDREYPKNLSSFFEG
jgi:hypothetical protein